MRRRIARMLPLAAGAAGGAYLAGWLLGHLYRWAEPHLADRIGGGHR